MKLGHGVEYDRSHLSNVKTNINGLTDEIKEYIADLDEFYVTFKEYIFFKGLVDAKNATVIDWNISENQLEIKFELDNTKNTILKTIINLRTDEIDILKHD